MDNSILEVIDKIFDNSPKTPFKITNYSLFSFFKDLYLKIENGSVYEDADLLEKYKEVCRIIIKRISPKDKIITCRFNSNPEDYLKKLLTKLYNENQPKNLRSGSTYNEIDEEERKIGYDNHYVRRSIIAASFNNSSTEVTLEDDDYREILLPFVKNTPNFILVLPTEFQPYRVYLNGVYYNSYRTLNVMPLEYFYKKINVYQDNYSLQYSYVDKFSVNYMNEYDQLKNVQLYEMLTSIYKSLTTGSNYFKRYLTHYYYKKLLDNYREKEVLDNETSFTSLDENFGERSQLFVKNYEKLNGKGGKIGNLQTINYDNRFHKIFFTSATCQEGVLRIVFPLINGLSQDTIKKYFPVIIPHFTDSNLSESSESFINNVKILQKEYFNPDISINENNITISIPVEAENASMGKGYITVGRNNQRLKDNKASKLALIDGASYSSTFEVEDFSSLFDDRETTIVHNSEIRLAATSNGFTNAILENGINVAVPYPENKKETIVKINGQKYLTTDNFSKAVDIYSLKEIRLLSYYSNINRYLFKVNGVETIDNKRYLSITPISKKELYLECPTNVYITDYVQESGTPNKKELQHFNYNSNGETSEETFDELSTTRLFEQFFWQNPNHLSFEADSYLQKGAFDLRKYEYLYPENVNANSLFENPVLKLRGRAHLFPENVNANSLFENPVLDLRGRAHLLPENVNASALFENPPLKIRKNHLADSLTEELSSSMQEGELSNYPNYNLERFPYTLSSQLQEGELSNYPNYNLNKFLYEEVSTQAQEGELVLNTHQDNKYSLEVINKAATLESTTETIENNMEDKNLTVTTVSGDAPLIYFNKRFYLNNENTILQS